ncbi:MAG: STT3 domain-containing protein [Candidatus Bathyarchaeia archaeon]|jgi:dolichyl-diphosphooligosaccharide--protein glycosyltransferase
MSATRQALRKVRGFLGKYINRETLAGRVEGTRKVLSGISRGTVIEAIVVGLIVLVALAVRIMPIRWGFFLNEFDPYLQWRMAQYVVDHGFLAWFSWHDTMSWYPYGADMPTWNLYGTAFVIAAITMILHYVGVNVTVFVVAVVFPVVAGTLTVLAAYFLGKDFWGKGAGLFTALFLALNPSSIGRTQLGFLRHEPLGILLMILLFLFFRRSTVPTSSTRKTLIYAGLTGFSLFYLAASWAAAYYPLDLLVVYAVILGILGRSSKKLFLSYSVTMGIFLLFTPFLVPKLGFGGLSDFTWLVIPVGEVVLLAREASTYVTNRKHQIYALMATVLGTIAVVTVLSYFHAVSLPYGKFYAVIDPFVRGQVPIIQSVAEHQPATWGSFFYEFGALIFLILFGFVFILQRVRNDDIFLLLWGVTAVYFAASFVRLTLLLAPAFCLLAAIGTVELGKPAVDIVREAVIYPKHKTRVISRIGREFGVAIFLILLIIIIPTFWTAVRGSYQPATIVTSSIPTAPATGQELKYADWLEALSWMRQNTPTGSVVFAWWDYGYWITALGDRRTLADNGTQNSTQIAVIAQTFLDNITMAIPNLEKYNVSYVAIFITPSGGSQGGYQGFGEDGKWYWMARIGNNTMWNNYKVIYTETVTATQTGSTSSSYTQLLQDSKGKFVSNDTIASNNQLNDHTMLGYMMALATNAANEQPSQYFTRVFSSSNNFVFLFQVRIPKAVHLSINPIKHQIPYGQQVVLAGNLGDPAGNALSISNPSVTLEASTDSGQTWQPIQGVPVSPNGTYSYTWTPDAGNYIIRAHYLGAVGPYADTSTTPQVLNVQTGRVNLSITTSSHSVTVGQNVTVTVQMSPFVSGANVTVSYTFDNKTFVPIENVIMSSPSMSFTWFVNIPGSFTLAASWPGNQNYDRALAEITLNKS